MAAAALTLAFAGAQLPLLLQIFNIPQEIACNQWKHQQSNTSGYLKCSFGFHGTGGLSIAFAPLEGEAGQGTYL